MNIVFIPKYDFDYETIVKQLRSFGREDIKVVLKSNYISSNNDVVEYDVLPNKENGLLLDFGRNLDRHGPIDKIRGKEIDLSSGEGEAPLKQCPSCFEPVYAAVRICPACGFEFPENELNITTKASDSAVLSTQIVPVEYQVFSVQYKRHKGKDGKPDSMMVIYNTMSGQIREWVFFDHAIGSTPHKKAMKWATLRGMNEIVSLEAALAIDWPKPISITAIKDGKYYNVKNAVFNVDTKDAIGI